jgi:hypothetical protein
MASELQVMVRLYKHAEIENIRKLKLHFSAHEYVKNIVIATFPQDYYGYLKA